MKKNHGPLFTFHPDGRITSEKWLLTIEEAAYALGYKKEYLQKQVMPSSKKGFAIQPVRIGKQVRFRLLDIVNYLKEREDAVPK